MHDEIRDVDSEIIIINFVDLNDKTHTQDLPSISTAYLASMLLEHEYTRNDWQDW